MKVDKFYREYYKTEVHNVGDCEFAEAYKNHCVNAISDDEYLKTYCEERAIGDNHRFLDEKHNFLRALMSIKNKLLKK